MDNIKPPESVVNTLALGQKFVYDGKTSEKQIKEFEALTQMIKEGQPAFWEQTLIELNMIKKQLIWDTLLKCLNEEDAIISIKAELRLHKFVTQNFLDSRTDICVVQADKNNILEMMTRKTYLQKMSQYMEKELMRHGFIDPSAFIDPSRSSG